MRGNCADNWGEVSGNVVMDVMLEEESKKVKNRGIYKNISKFDFFLICVKYSIILFTKLP